MTRRLFSGLVVVAGSAALGAVIGIPALILGLTPVLQRSQRVRWRRLGELESFPPGAVHQARIEGVKTDWPAPMASQPVFVWRPSEERVVVFSRSCTDLGCPLAYDSGSACFFCPCHGGVFDQNGDRLAGPTQLPMYRFAHRIRDGVLEIDVASLPPGV